jgi:hypothetical protein
MGVMKRQYTARMVKAPAPVEMLAVVAVAGPVCTRVSEVPSNNHNPHRFPVRPSATRTLDRPPTLQAGKLSFYSGGQP